MLVTLFGVAVFCDKTKMTHILHSCLRCSEKLHVIQFPFILPTSFNQRQLLFLVDSRMPLVLFKSFNGKVDFWRQRTFASSLNIAPHSARYRFSRNLRTIRRLLFYCIIHYEVTTSVKQTVFDNAVDECTLAKHDISNPITSALGRSA